MDEFKLKNFNKFVENFKLKQQQEFKPTVEENVNEVVERLNLPEVKEKLDSIKFKGKEFGAFKELSDEEVEQALEKDSNKTKIIETLKKLNFKNISQEPKTEICEVEGAKASPTVDDIEVGAGSGSTKRHVFKSVSFTAGLEYLNSLSVRTTRTTPSVEPPVNWGGFEPSEEPTQETIEYATEIALNRPAISNISNTSGKISVTSQPICLTLTNPFTGENYKYSVSLSEDRVAAANKNLTSTNVTFSFLANGILVIDGSYLKIQAWDLNIGDQGQQDDLIIMGNYNEVYTGDGNDTVRNGSVLADWDNYYYGNYTNNIINTGAGNDFLRIYNLGANTVDMGEGSSDKCYYSTNNSSTSITNCETKRTASTLQAEGYQDNLDGWARQGGQGNCGIISLVNMLGKCTNNYDFSNIITKEKTENGYRITFNKITDSNLTNTVEITLAEINAKLNNGSPIYSYGDFDTRLFLAALTKALRVNYETSLLNKQVEYTAEGYYVWDYSTGKWKLKYFTLQDYLNGNGTIEYTDENGTQKTATLPKGEDNLEDHFEWLWWFYNDSELAKKLSYWLTGQAKQTALTKYDKQKIVDGETVDTTTAERKAQLKERILNIWSHYENGGDEIKLVTLSFGSVPRNEKEKQLGIISGHAYAIKNIKKDSSDEYYIELVNPWNDAECIRFSLSSLIANYYDYLNINFYGNSNTEINNATTGYARVPYTAPDETT